MSKLVALAFSGGLDTSWCVPWLKEHGSERIVTVTVDVGGMTDEDRRSLEERSQELRADRHIYVDARRAFFDEIVQYLIFGNVLRGQAYPLCVGAERSLQAREVARVARELKADAIAHGCTAAGNDQVRFEVALRVVAPDVALLAPVRDEAPRREDEVRFLLDRGYSVPAKATSYSINAGLWGVTIGGKETLDTRESLPEDAWVRTRGAFDRPMSPEVHTISFVRGIPSALDGQSAEPVTVIEAIDALASRFGIGRGIHLGETILGMKGRVAFEAPAASTIITAHRELEKLVLTGRQTLVKDTVSRTYGDLIHEGQFLEPTCRDIEALLRSTQERVTGDVRCLFRQGSLFVEGVTSPYSLKDASKALYGEAAGEWTPEDARGFSRLVGLPSMLHARAKEGGRS